MAASTVKAKDDLETLKSTIKETLDVITKVSGFSPSTTRKDGNVDVLDLASNAASLIRAHSTKLSLFMIHKPFTPSAISKVLGEIVAGPLMALATAINLCDATKQTKAMDAELRWRINKVLKEFGVLVEVIPLDGNVLNDDAKKGTGKHDGKGSLAKTGVVWKACDDVIDLKKLGVAGLLAKMAEDYRGLIEDALSELQEWGDQKSDTDEEDSITGGDDEEDEAQADLDSLFGSQKHIPSEDPDKIRPRLESSLKRLRLVTHMYQAIVKRRLNKLPPFPHQLPHAEIAATRTVDEGIVNTVDEVMAILKTIPEIADELASAFYSLDPSETDKRMEECFSTGSAAVKLLIKNWDGEEDEFSIWGSKFQGAMKS